MVDVREIRFTDYADQMGDILRANWGETGFGFPFALDIPTYQRMEQTGLLLAIGAFHGEEVIGYSSAVVAPHPYNPNVICCNTDALYVRPAYRNGATVYKLVTATRQAAKQRGANLMIWHTRAGTKFGKALEKRGYRCAEAVYIKEL